MIRLTNNPESERADAILEEWRGVNHDDEIIIVQSETLTVDGPSFQAHAEGLFAGRGPDPWGTRATQLKTVPGRVRDVRLCGASGCSTLAGCSARLLHWRHV